MAILDAIDSGSLNARVSLVLSNTLKAGALEKASSRGISTEVISEKSFENFDEYSIALVQKLADLQIETIVLAGFLRKIPELLIQNYPNQILNIHPSLLPAFGGKGFYGQRVHEAVVKRGVKWTGVTIHYVTANYDEGPIILQELVEVLPRDSAETLAQRVLLTEHNLYPKALELHVNNRLEIKDGLVTIKS